MAIEGIDWDNLRVFQVVADLGSMTAAAARLKESPPTISRKIDELEGSLNSKLFTRSTRGVSLTEAGRVALRYAKQMEEAANEVAGQVAGKDSDIEGRITIGVGDGVGPHWIARHFTAFRQLHPKLQVRMVSRETELNLLEDEANIVIRFSEPKDPEIISHKLGTVHYIAFASEDYLSTKSSIPTSLFEYYHHPCILYEAYVNQIERWAPKAIELRKMIDYAFITNSATAMIELCRNGGGLALLPSYMKEIFPDLVALDMSEVAPVQFWITYTEQTRRNPAGHAMIEWIKSLFLPERSPWFTDGFVHPKELETMASEQAENVIEPRLATQ